MKFVCKQNDRIKGRVGKLREELFMKAFLQEYEMNFLDVLNINKGGNER